MVATFLACSNSSINTMMKLSPPASSRKYPFCCMQKISLHKMIHVFAINRTSYNSYGLILRPDICILPFRANKKTSFRLSFWFKLNPRSFPFVEVFIGLINRFHSGWILSPNTYVNMRSMQFCMIQYRLPRRNLKWPESTSYNNPYRINTFILLLIPGLPRF